MVTKSGIITRIKININNLDSDILFSKQGSSAEQTSIQRPTLSSKGDLFFISNEKLYKTDINGSNLYKFGISVTPYSPIYISQNVDLILVDKSSYRILLCTSVGMDFTTLPYSGRRANFINNNECVYYTTDDVKIGKLDGSSSHKIADGRFPEYFHSEKKIYYLHIKFGTTKNE